MTGTATTALTVFSAEGNRGMPVLSSVNVGKPVDVP